MMALGLSAGEQAGVGCGDRNEALTSNGGILASAMLALGLSTGRGG